MVVPILATAAWLGLGVLGVVGAKEKETQRLRSNATLREQRNAAESAVNRNYTKTQNAYARYLRKSSSAFGELDEDRWNALSAINNKFAASLQNSTVFFDFTMPVLKGATLALDLFGKSIVGSRASK